MSKCDECGITPAYEGGAFCTNCKPQTNADKIRTLDDEKLAEWMSIALMGAAGDVLRSNGIEFKVDVWGMRNDVLEWLKQEAT